MKPIIFSGPMVRAILEGRKTQTRRVIKPQPELTISDELYKQNMAMMPDLCPYGQVGDRLWARETHYRFGYWAYQNKLTKSGKQAKTFHPVNRNVRYADNPPDRLHACLTLREVTERGLVEWYKRPAIFMPRWASRITLEITGVKVERIQDISQGDSYAELGKSILAPTRALGGILGEFRDLWDSINSKRGYRWDVNPWVWALAFKVV